MSTLTGAFRNDADAPKRGGGVTDASAKNRNQLAPVTDCTAGQIRQELQH